MANLITNKKVDAPYLQMSNGLTAVFIETMCLAGAGLANQNYQKDLLIWFAQRDAAILGAGFTGFDISDIIWSREQFNEQKRFLLAVIDEVFRRKNWKYLSYQPNEKFLFPEMENFRQMISAFQPDMIDNHPRQNGIFEFNGDVAQYDRCGKHQIYLHPYGCVICNNEAE